MDLADILERGEAAFIAAIELGVTEGLNLEFKGVTTRLFSEGSLNRDGRRLIAKAVSGFANSDGGLIVLGIGCRPREGVDQARTLEPIPNLSKSFSSLNSQLGELVQPRHDGVRAFRVLSAAREDEGYIVLDVQRSERRPHMSSASKSYYKRSNASTFEMEHYDVEDAFRRITAPVLELSWAVSGGTTMQLAPCINIGFSVTNEGATTAKHVSIAIKRRSGPRLHVPIMYTQFQVERKPDESILIAAPENLVINPRQSVRFHFAFAECRMRDGIWHMEDEPLTSVSIDYLVELSAENMMPREQIMQILPDTLAAKPPPSGT